MNVSEKLAFGTAAITSLSNPVIAQELLNTAFDLGIRQFDTAPLYGQGYSEKIVGTFIKYNRKDIVVNTKFGLGSAQIQSLPIILTMPMNYFLKKIIKKTALPVTQQQRIYPHRIIDLAYVKAHFESSIKRLNTEYIDTYLLHEGVPAFLSEEAFYYLLNLKKQGRVLNIGIAANIVNTDTLNQNDVAQWDTLQYEGNYTEVQAATIINKFPEKIHHWHSCLKNINTFPEIPPQDKGAYTLAEYAKKNTKGKIIFSTTKREQLKNNLQFFDKYYKI